MCMFLIIIVVVMVSYILKVLILIVELLNIFYWEEQMDLERIFFEIIYCFYILYYISNLFIYVYFDL